ncbi:related to tetratricopeptide repeat protein tpr1 [Phialocephala subalpina]|uniref:Related to tetratricopeptide repeat protein tpr1 n=1 Tax=Phialocephala subalpina TaxID=576137 RepID=A0A1L7XP48_9HELO|nr:related to tetratricopeptide repeat protein tpr1 [Phialocephala subalpina]
MPSTLQDDHANGAINGAANDVPTTKRFSDIPSTLDIPVHIEQRDEDEDEAEAVEIYLKDLADPNELCSLLEIEQAAPTYWMSVALAYAKQNKVDYAIETLIRGGNSTQDHNSKGKLSILSCLCWMYLWKSREAPRLAPEGTLESEAKTKEYYLQLAISTLNDASRINPSFPPLFLARGVLYLLKASLQPPSKATAASAVIVDLEKADLLRQAFQSFEDAIRVSRGKNMLAVMGRSKVLFSLGKYPEALAGYQEVLAKMPDFVDPDPRIGIGCCLWKLEFKDDARVAWERSLEINPNSKIANLLLGLYYLDASSSDPIGSPEFTRLYKKAITEYIQKSFKSDSNLPLTCATFAGYFLSRKSFTNVDSLSNKAIQYTDINAIASDGWYLLGRKEHYAGNLDRASDCYRRADDARGGVESGYLPAKFGVAQLFILQNDLSEAKLLLEKIVQHCRNHEATVLLGTLFAEEFFANQYAFPKDDKSPQRAILLLESVRSAWKDSKRTHLPDASVLLNLARLYEIEYPDKALQCLLQVEQLELDRITESEHPMDVKDDAEAQAVLRKFLPPQLTNNIGCFYFQAEKYDLAREMFETALSACMRLREEDDDDDDDIDALITTISFNLGRSYEAIDLTDQAIDVYERLLKHHEGYTDARTRLAYIKLCISPQDKGPDSVAKLYQENSTDLEVRALYGWYLGKVYSRRRPANIAEDPELRHYKHTLQHHDKHDHYALVGMGNLYLQSAREMRRDTEQEKQKRSAVYSKAVEFFEKAIQLDPQNAYAAHGIAIALIEDKKDFQNALLILRKVQDTIKDAYVYLDLGHIYSELKHYSKAIESYGTALSKESKANDPSILACLGRAWLNKGRAGRDLDAYQMALECSQKALDASPNQVHLKFNVAFAQIQLVTTLYSLNETQRSLQQLQDATKGLELAIVTLDEIAAHPQCPYPKHDVDQRANMARNTLQKQLERAVASQEEYEENNKEQRRAAMERRQAELKRREEERERALGNERERLARIKKEREEIIIRDRQLAEQRAEEERATAAADMTTDSETGEKIKRKRRAPKTKGEQRPKNRSGKKGSSESEDTEEGPRPKKRRLAKKDTTQYKSAEIVADSDDDNVLEQTEIGMGKEETQCSDMDGVLNEHDSDIGGVNYETAEAEDEETEASTRSRPQKRSRRVRIVDESDDEEGEDRQRSDHQDNSDE